MASKMILVHEEKKEFKVFKLYSWMMMYKDVTFLTIFLLPLYILVLPYALFCRRVIRIQRHRMLRYLKQGYRLDTTDYNSVYIYVQWLTLPLLPSPDEIKANQEIISKFKTKSKETEEVKEKNKA